MKKTDEINEIQNIYDNPTFFESYKKLRKNDLGFNNLIEQPILRSLLPALKGKVVMDIGCGFGDFCRYAAAQGASKIKGIDPSVNEFAVHKICPLARYCFIKKLKIRFFMDPQNNSDINLTQNDHFWVKSKICCKFPFIRSIELAV
jgi:SAM-dependent methyltransferase